MKTKSLIQNLISKSKKGLEIGPSHNPMAPKSEGYQVDILDQASMEELIQSRNRDNLDASRIEHVDYIWNGQPMSQLIGEDKRYQWIIASHVIEHIPDIISFLSECQKLLDDDGILILTVPDKRYCFDYFRSYSMTGDIYQAFLEKRIRQTQANIWNHNAYAARRGSDIGWFPDNEIPPAFVHDLDYSWAETLASQKDDRYRDVHIWNFTPSSFRLILKEINLLGLTDLREHEVINENTNEFIVTLSKSGKGCSLSRLQLCRHIQEEISEPLVRSLVSGKLRSLEEVKLRSPLNKLKSLIKILLRFDTRFSHK